MNKTQLSESWYKVLEEELVKPYTKELMDKVVAEYNATKVYPSPAHVFNAFRITPFEEVKVIIIGQDPYPHGDHAHGLAFSSQQKETPFSLQIILREVDRDVIGTTNLEEFKQCFPSNNLTPWAKQGVFLLNTYLTVRAGEPGSHKSFGWEKFTKACLQSLFNDQKPKVFIAWGAEAEKIASDLFFLNESPHLLLEAGHPAAAAHGMDKFSGCNHFSKANRFLKLNGITEINWKLNE